MSIQDDWDLLTDADFATQSYWSCPECSDERGHGSKSTLMEPFVLRMPGYFHDELAERSDAVVDHLGIAALDAQWCSRCRTEYRYRALHLHRVLAIYFSLERALEDHRVRDTFPKTLHVSTTRRILDLLQEGISPSDVAQRLNKQEGLPPVKGRWDASMIRTVERYGRRTGFGEPIIGRSLWEDS